jgi:peptidylprolyl isomerase
MKFFALIVVFCIALAIASCGGNGSAGVTGESTASRSSTAKQASAPSSGPEGSRGSADAPPRPHISIPSAPPPKQLVVKDLKKGTGAPLETGDEFSVRYLSFDYDTGDPAEDHWGNNSIFSWTFGPGRVVRAWAKGLPGMRVGGRRELIAPGRLAYDKRYAMIWVVELLSVGK